MSNEKNISFSSKDIDFQIVNIDLYRNWLNKIAKEEKRFIAEINYYFVSEKEIVRINKNFLNHNYSTDIITFDNSFLKQVSGDIYICISVVRNNAKEYSNSNFRDELNRVIVHGLLHLTGYNDQTELQKFQMRSKENYYLKYLDQL